MPATSRPSRLTMRARAIFSQYGDNRLSSSSSGLVAHAAREMMAPALPSPNSHSLPLIFEPVVPAESTIRDPEVAESHRQYTAVSCLPHTCPRNGPERTPMNRPSPSAIGSVHRTLRQAEPGRVSKEVSSASSFVSLDGSQRVACPAISPPGPSSLWPAAKVKKWNADSTTATQNCLFINQLSKVSLH